MGLPDRRPTLDEQQRIRAETLRRFRGRNMGVAFALTALVTGLYSYTLYKVKPDAF
jgi:hypothetical protein